MSFRPQRRLPAALIGAGLLCLAPLAQAADTDIARNKALVQGFWNDVFIARKADAAAKYMKPDYVEHDPHVRGGLKGFQDFIRQEYGQPPPTLKEQLLNIVAEGDLVVTYTQFSFTDPQGKPVTGTNFHMYRIKDGMIAEHWDDAPES